MRDLYGDRTATLADEQELHEPVGVLAVAAGPDGGLSVELPERATVGKSAAATVRLSDAAVSRLHVVLERAGDAIRVVDQGSKNGTWIGPLRIHDAVVPPGTRLRIGSTELVLAVRSGRVRRARWHGGERLGSLLGRSAAMQEVFARLARIGPAESRVLLRGESGTGKELAARTLHALSPRAGGPFVVVDAPGIAGSLVEDALFGHVRGAFTGADEERAGAFERAHGGTLFLDEIGDLPLALQVKLLRALEDGTVQRIGATERARVDVRVIAATHRSLERMVNEHTFREDLFYRLAVLVVTMPPLRARLGDVPLLAHALLREDGAATPEALTAVEQALGEHRGHAWPGNVRELRNFVRRVAVLGPAHAQIEHRELPSLSVRVDLPFKEAKERWVEQFEREYIERILDEAADNIAEAARRTGVSRVHLSNLVKKHGLR